MKIGTDGDREGRPGLTAGWTICQWKLPGYSINHFNRATGIATDWESIHKAYIPTTVPYLP